MILSFYDRNFKALQNNASLVVGNWCVKRRAVDFDDFTATSEPFLEDANPTFVVMCDDLGKYYYGAFAGIPQLDSNNQTKLQASDLKTIFNSDISIAFGSYSTVKDYFAKVFTEFNSQVVKNSFTVQVDYSATENITMSSLKPTTNYAVYNVWEDLIVPYLKYYDLYMESSLDVVGKKILFKIGVIKKTSSTIPIRLWEFGIKNYGKHIAPVNETEAVVNKESAITHGFTFILLEDNSITTNSSYRDLYPIKRKVFLKEVAANGNESEELTKANQEALKYLVEARYNESLEIDTKGIQIYQNASFSSMFDIYVKKGVLYKKLPLGEISDDNTGVRKLKIGYKVDDLVFYI